MIRFLPVRTSNGRCACLLLPFLQPWEHSIYRSRVSGDVSVSSTVSSVTALMNAAESPEVPWEILAIVLASGIFIRLIWLAIGFLRLRLFEHKSHMFLEEHPAVRDMQWRTGVRVPLLLSGQIDSPVTFGFRPPIVILPLSFKELSEPCQRAILCHELLHVRRYDWVLIIAEEFVRALLWFHPAIWWLLSRIHLSREQAIDYEVVKLTGSKQPYLDSLLEFARVQGRPRAVPAPLFLKEHHFVQRVALLIKEVSMSRSRLAVSMIGISVLLTGTVRLAAGWFPLAGAPAQVQSQKEKIVPGIAVSPLDVSEPVREPVKAAENTAEATKPAVQAPEQNVETGIKAPQSMPIRIGGNIQESKLIYKVDPIYPKAALEARIQGIIKLTIIINEEGAVYEIRTKPGNNPILEEAAIDAVEHWQYSPTHLDDKPVPVEATVTVVFKQKEGPPLVEEQSVASDSKPPQGSPIRLDGNVAESRLIHRVEPEYPEIALKSRIQGSVVLTVTVNEEGFVYDVQVVSGHPFFVGAATKAVKQWRYSPTTVNGVAVPVVATVTIVFNLR